MKTAIVKLESVSPYSQSKHHDTEKLDKVYSYHAVAAVSAAIGINVDELQSAVSDWYEKRGDLPKPVGYDQLIEKMKESRQFWKTYSSDIADENQ